MIPREEFKQILKELRTKFPGAFPKNKFVVLKKGIDLDILKRSGLNIGRTKLKTCLKIYTAHPGYIDIHKPGANRYDITGEVTGQVTEQEYLNIKKNQELRLKQKRFLEQKRKEQQLSQTDN